MSEWTKIVPEGVSPTGFAVWFSPDIREFVVTCPSCSTDPMAKLYRDWDTATVWVCRGCSTLWSLPWVGFATCTLDVGTLVTLGLSPSGGGGDDPAYVEFCDLMDRAELWVANWMGWDPEKVRIDLFGK